MKTNLREGMIIKPNENHMCFNEENEILKIVQIGMSRVFAENVESGEYVGLIGNCEEIEYYYDVVK